MSSQFKNKPVQPSNKAHVQQNFAKDADINLMLARHMAGPNRMNRIGNPNASVQPRFLDLSSSDSYHDMLNRVTQINSMFMRLPGKLRARFQNRPELLMKFAEDPANVKEAVKLGLIDNPAVVQEVLEAQAEEEARKAAEAAEANKADPEAQPPYTPPKGGNTPNPA